MSSISQAGRKATYPSSNNLNVCSGVRICVNSYRGPRPSYHLQFSQTPILAKQFHLSPREG